MTGRFGVFGKIPGHGDFVQTGLPRDFVRVWDAWVQRGLTEARGALGPTWSDAYFSAPCWRFLLPPGAAGEAAVQGVLMPSVDRVGREFPLTLAAMLPTEIPPLEIHFHSDALLYAMETLALSALDADVTLAEIEAGLARLALPISTAAETGERPGLRMVSRAGEGGALPDLAACLVGQGAPSVSLWSSQTADASQAFAAQGLPAPATFAHLVDPFDRATVRARYV